MAPGCLLLDIWARKIYSFSADLDSVKARGDHYEEIAIKYY